MTLNSKNECFTTRQGGHSPPSSSSDVKRIACEAAHLLNESNRQLQALSFMLKLVEKWEEEQPERLIQGGGGLRNILMSSTILHLRRLKETRDYFLVKWLFTEDELGALGFRPLEDLVGGKEQWKALEILRHQFAGHATRRKPPRNMAGEIIPGEIYGKALRETGILDLDSFLRRVQEEVLDGVINVRDELARRFPEVSKFIKEDYPFAIEKGRLDQPKSGTP